jgi:hypothetical protein
MYLLSFPDLTSKLTWPLTDRIVTASLNSTSLGWRRKLICPCSSFSSHARSSSGFRSVFANSTRILAMQVSGVLTLSVERCPRYLKAGYKYVFDPVIQWPGQTSASGFCVVCVQQQYTTKLRQDVVSLVIRCSAPFLITPSPMIP